MNKVTLDVDSNSGSEDFNYRKNLSDSSSASNEDEEKFHRRKRVDIRERTARPPPVPENPAPLHKPMGNKNAITPFKRNYDDHFEPKLLKRPSTPPPYLGKRPAFSSILQGASKQVHEAPITQRVPSDKPFPFINNFRGGIPPPPMPIPTIPSEKIDSQSSNQLSNQQGFNKNQSNFQRTPQETNPQFLINNLNNNLQAIQMNQEANNVFPSQKLPHGQNPHQNSVQHQSP